MRRAGKPACWPTQERTHVHSLTPITFLNRFPATEAWDQPLSVRGHQQGGQRRCLPPCQTLQATQHWQIPTFSLKTGPVRKGLYQFQLACCLGVGTDWYSHGDNKKKKEGSLLSFSTRNFVSRFCHLIRKTVLRRKRNIFNGISSFKYFGFPSWNHLTPPIGSFLYDKLGCASWQF